MKNKYENYKETICPYCIHYKEYTFMGCHIAETLDKSIKCVEYKKRRREENESKSN